MDIQVQRTYSEVYGILNMMGKYYINKIPTKLYQMIEKERDKNYNPQYDYNKTLDSQNVSKNALSMIALIHINYWMDQEEKREIKSVLFKNEQEIKEKYNPDNLFKKREKTFEPPEEEIKQETQLIEKKENFIQKIFNKIKKIFKK